MIEVREMTIEDLEETLKVESSAIRGNPGYLEDAFHYYQGAKGELSVALMDGKIVGIGKLSILFDGSAWLEVLRVHQDYQKMGVGAAIYKRYFDQVETFNPPHVALYTGIKNIGSRKLAERNGLSQDTFYVSYSTTNIQSKEVVPFEMMDTIPGNIDIPHLNINHTFYRNNEANLKGFLSQGYIYQYKDTTLIMGSRFQPKKALYIAYISGTYKKEALDYSMQTAYMKGIKKITYHICSEHEKPLDLLETYQFTQDPGEDMVMTLCRKK